MTTKIDRDIKALQKQIETLEAEKAAVAKKEEGLAKLAETMQGIFDEYGINERDLFEARAKQILGWAKSVAGEAEPSKLQEKLSALFTGTVGRKPKVQSTAKRSGKKGRRKGKGKPDPKLATGTYLNPNTKETVQKIRRAPKQLLQWVEEHGIEAVTAWRQS